MSTSPHKDGEEKDDSDLVPSPSDHDIHQEHQKQQQQQQQQQLDNQQQLQQQEQQGQQHIPEIDLQSQSQQAQQPEDEMQGHPATQEQGSLYETDVKEQDRWLPIANVARIMKQALPDNAKIAKEAKECMQECVSEFISFITSEASEKCQAEKRKTVNGEDIIFAMTSLGFENYSEALRIYLVRYRETNLSKGENQQANRSAPPTAGLGPDPAEIDERDIESPRTAASLGGQPAFVGAQETDTGAAGFSYPGQVVSTNGNGAHY